MYLVAWSPQSFLYPRLAYWHLFHGPKNPLPSEFPAPYCA